MPEHATLSGMWSTLRRRGVRASRATYVGLERSRLAPLLRVGLIERVKARITYTPAERVLAILDLVAAAGVPAWVAGGWGVDALVGRQTRRHHDLDLVIDDSPDAYRTLAEALAANGFRLTDEELNPGLFMPSRRVWRHDDGHSVEVLPVPLHRPPFGAASEDGPTRDARSPFTHGWIAGRVVPCLSARLQLILHTGYTPRTTDAEDMELLRSAAVTRHDQVPV